MYKFVGRENELSRLEKLYNKRINSLVVIKGRRRVGKSCLINFFASKYCKNKLWDFSALAPKDDIDDQDQRDHFSRQLANHLKVSPFTFQDWSDAFDHLNYYIKDGDIILFDEISWMGFKDSSFIAKLKVWWDKQNIPVMLFLSGSISTWIEENILKSTAFFGRINLTISLEALSITDSNKLLQLCGFKGSDYDTYKLLSILGGIPWYLEQILPGESLEYLIKQFCFEKDSLLLLEFDRIFNDLFNNKGHFYKKILNVLKDGMKTLSDIRNIIEFPKSGTLSKLMENLIIAGFVQKQNLWSFKSNKTLKQSLYYICDPYMRFYLKLIEPNINKINLNIFEDFHISKMLGFDSHIGLQLEILLLQNRNILLNYIGINKTDIINCGPFRQFKTTIKKGCQIDFLIQTTTKTLFLCEFKFKRKELGLEIIDQIQDKIDSLKVPSGFSVVPVLFHIGGVSTNVAISNYFYRIIDISDFLRNEC